jgi:hypothetical protein
MKEKARCFAEWITLDRPPFGGLDRGRINFTLVLL